MSARGKHSRHQEIEVFFFIGHTLITLFREDTYLQNKSQLYYLKKKILAGKYKLPEKSSIWIKLKLDGSIEIV
jgi:hypothetical protein